MTPRPILWLALLLGLHGGLPVQAQPAAAGWAWTGSPPCRPRSRASQRIGRGVMVVLLVMVDRQDHVRPAPVAQPWGTQRRHVADQPARRCRSAAAGVVPWRALRYARGQIPPRPSIRCRAVAAPAGDRP